jgi:hypothetical protein
VQSDTTPAPVVPHPPFGTPRRCDQICNAAQVAVASPGLNAITPDLQLLNDVCPNLKTSIPGMPRTL